MYIYIVLIYILAGSTILSTAAGHLVHFDLSPQILLLNANTNSNSVRKGFFFAVAAFKIKLGHFCFHHVKQSTSQLFSLNVFEKENSPQLSFGQHVLVARVSRNLLTLSSAACTASAICHYVCHPH